VRRRLNAPQLLLRLLLRLLALVHVLTQASVLNPCCRWPLPLLLPPPQELLAEHAQPTSPMALCCAATVLCNEHF
jgi:hypothetical protein